ncbi:MAG: thiamine-phosphate kinase [Prevotellaceae bacterium]|jgi:thiamine-monophosphate kinase|nr:thiamine-phosphate kinase [Prevotellaceae bacterium]
MAKKLTDIAGLGAVKLLDHITKAIEAKQPSTVKGLGDDAAVTDYNGAQTVTATALLLEGVHFDLTYTPLKHLGYKTVISAINKIYAMNAKPAQVMITAGLSQRFAVEHVEELFGGVATACTRYGLDLVDVALSTSLTGLTLGATATGAAPAAHLVYRSGGKPTDLLCLTGNLGAAYMGLQLLKREKTVFEGNSSAQPQLEGYSYILERHLKPEAQKDVIDLLAAHHLVPTAMISVSEGLAAGTLHLCKQSNCGARIYLERLPIASETFRMAGEMNLDAVVAALHGGDDFELLFTLPVTLHDVVRRELQGIDVIGHLTGAGEGAHLITPDNQTIALKAQGWTTSNEQ